MAFQVDCVVPTFSCRLINNVVLIRVKAVARDIIDGSTRVDLDFIVAQIAAYIPDGFVPLVTLDRVVSRCSKVTRRFADRCH